MTASVTRRASAADREPSSSAARRLSAFAGPMPEKRSVSSEARHFRQMAAEFVKYVLTQFYDRAAFYAGREYQSHQLGVCQALDAVCKSFFARAEFGCHLLDGLAVVWRLVVFHVLFSFSYGYFLVEVAAAAKDYF